MYVFLPWAPVLLEILERRRAVGMRRRNLSSCRAYLVCRSSWFFFLPRTTILEYRELFDIETVGHVYFIEEDIFPPDHIGDLDAAKSGNRHSEWSISTLHGWRTGRSAQNVLKRIGSMNLAQHMPSISRSKWNSYKAHSSNHAIQLPCLSVSVPLVGDAPNQLSNGLPLIKATFDTIWWLNDKRRR